MEEVKDDSSKARISIPAGLLRAERPVNREGPEIKVGYLKDIKACGDMHGSL